MVEIGQLPLSHQDFDDSGDPPGSWTAFRQQVKTFDAVLFVTPAYNRSVPAPLTNAIDVGERNCKRHSLSKKGDAYDREEITGSNEMDPPLCGPACISHNGLSSQTQP